MIVLDTHAVVWLAETPELLSVTAQETILRERLGDGLAISDKTLWELAMLISRGRVQVKTSLGDFLRTIERHFKVLPVTAQIAEQAVSFSDRYPTDPTDQIIGATAVIHGLPLLTRDRMIRESGEVNCVW